MNKIEINFPYFEGFYESVWYYKISDLDDMINEDNDNKEELLLDFQNSAIEICKLYINVMNEIYNEFGIKFTFKDLDSPKFYNFETDKLGLICEYTDKAQKLISGAIYDNQESFIELLEDRHKGCSGFISFYSHKFNEWEYLTKEFTEFPDNVYFETCFLHFSEVNELYDYDSIQCDAEFESFFPIYE